MKREIFSSIIGTLLFCYLIVSCDDGKIYDENRHVEIEGGVVKLTATIKNIDTWPTDYNIVIAGFKKDEVYATAAKTITPEKDGTVDLVLKGVSNEVSQIEVCVINKLRKRIVSFYETDFTDHSDTLKLDIGTINASLFNGIQKTVFDGYCINCHGASTGTADGLYLTEGKSYAALVNIQANSSEEGKMLVKPKDTENSFILDVLTEGATNHYHTDILSGAPEKISLLKSWIEEGAKE